MRGKHSIARQKYSKRTLLCGCAIIMARPCRGEIVKYVRPVHPTIRSLFSVSVCVSKYTIFTCCLLRFTQINKRYEKHPKTACYSHSKSADRKGR